MGIKTVPQPPYGSDLAPCDFWLFPKLRGCRYETIEEMKEAVMKVIDILTQEDFNVMYSHIQLHVYIYTREHNYNDDFNNEWIHFFIKI